MKLKFLLLTTICFFTVLAAKAGAPPGGDEPNAKNDLAGGVYHSETKKPLGSVSVTAYLSSKKEKSVVTDANGNYSFNDLKPGTYKFVFEKDGYKKITKDKVVIRQDEGFQMDIELSEHTSFDFMPGPFHFSEFD